MVTIPPNLPNPTEAFKRAEVAQQLEELKRQHEELAREAVNVVNREFAAKYPDYAKKHGLTFDGHVHTRKPGAHIIPPKFLERMLLKGLHKSKAQIVREVQKLVPTAQQENVHYSLWYKKLTSRQWAKMQQLISTNSVHYVSIKGCKTLDEIRDKLIAAEIKRNPTFEAKAQIVIGNAKVTVGKKAYSIIKNPAKGKTYPIIKVMVNGKQASIRVDALRALLSR